MPRVLITGAGGYIGGRLAPVLLARGHEVVALVREPAPALPVGAQVICDLAGADAWETVLDACEGIDAVIHLAGENEVLAGRRPAAALAATVVATERVAEACARTGVARLVYMSTVHVYGARTVPGALLTEDMRVEPRSAYATSRLASEHVAATFTADRTELVVLRLTNSVGAPHDPAVDRWSLVANDLSRQGTLDGRLVLRSSGMQWRDFIPLSDVCDSVARAVEGAPPPGTYNLGSGEVITVRALAGLVQDAFERETGERPALEAPPHEGEPPGSYRVSVEQAAAHGLRARSSLRDAVTETVRFCLEHRDTLPR